MPIPPRTSPVEDSIPKIENELAVGENLEFQRRWWRFERIVWIIFTLIIIADLAGVLGRGPLSRAHDETPDAALGLNYDRFERFQTPSVMTLRFSPQAVRNGTIQLWVSQNFIKALGNQRVIPQPERSELADGGILYTWPSAEHPDDVEFALQPSSPGLYHFTMRIPSLNDQLRESVFVYP